MTIRELVEARYGNDITYDTAMPQQWVDAMRDRGFDVRGHFVTLYPQNQLSYMAPVTDQGVRMAAIVATHTA